jgi:hypothetical protein
MASGIFVYSTGNYNSDTNTGIFGDALWKSQRWFLEISQQARHIKRGEARRVLVQRYIDNVVAADRKMVAKVFHTKILPGQVLLLIV